MRWVPDEVEVRAVEPTAPTATDSLLAELPLTATMSEIQAQTEADFEAVVDGLENRLAGQTSDLVRMRKNAQTSQALLDLHTACTRQRTVAGTARQIAAVASAITGSQIVIVSVFQVANQQPLLAVSLGDGLVDEEQIGDLVCDMAGQPDMGWLRTENRLRVITRESSSPSTALLLAELHAERVLITPLFGQGEFVGCIVAKLPNAAPDRDDIGVIEGSAAAVTGLPNLAVYEQRLVRALARRAADQPGHSEVAAILVQVVQLGRITEIHGATGVQELLREIANRLSELAPEHDLGHLGASHFALIAHGEPGAGIDLARTVIDALDVPFEVSFGSLRVFCHVGVAVTADGESASSLLPRAEAAARRARDTDERLVTT
jgi:GGDEF domain-containing protein